MIKYKNITIKNFLSIGNVTQSVNFEENELTLVLGENLDLGGSDCRNGVGKSSMVNALSYALYGNALTNIKMDNLINKTNKKGMLVTIDFEKDNKSYRIERGRKPNLLRLYIDDQEIENEDETNDAKGENRVTQEDIEKIVGCSHTMFKMVHALNTYNLPFLSMSAANQREIIEQLLGVTKLSEKAESLKVLVKETKELIKDEETTVSAIRQANAQIDSSIKSIQSKSIIWNTNKDKRLEDTTMALSTMHQTDIEKEIANHKLIESITSNEKELAILKREQSSISREHDQGLKTLELYISQLDSLKLNKCHSCEQDLPDHDHTAKKKSLENDIQTLGEEVLSKSNELTALNDAIAQLPEIQKKPSTFYSNIDDAYNHKSSVETLASSLEGILAETNPYEDQVDILEAGKQEVDYTEIERLTSIKDHQEFLLKLLTNKDSFIRKKIIEQNLAFLNGRLDYYLKEIGLPHTVEFLSDLSVNISEHGRELDFDNLSRGERTRLILSLSWAFRDIYEALNDKCSILFIDELIDSGLDVNGVENSLTILKRMSRESNRNVFLISHRDELVGRVDSILKVVKENGFTSFEQNAEVSE